jgi:hypothetical protein
VITVENIDGHIPSIKFSREIFLTRFTVGVWFFFFLFPTELTRNGELPTINISLVMPSVKLLPTNCVPYTNKINPSVKLFNSVVFQQK